MRLLFGIIKEEDRNIKVLNRWEPSCNENDTEEYGVVLLASEKTIDIDEVELTVCDIEGTILKTGLQNVPDELFEFSKEISEGSLYMSKRVIRKEQFPKEAAIEITIQNEECKPLYVHVVV